MAIPQTAVQIAMMMQAFDRKVLESQETMRRLHFNPILDMIGRRIIRRRPYTDDMFQMLQDLGIEPPDHNWISQNGLKIEWRRR